VVVFGTLEDLAIEAVGCVECLDNYCAEVIAVDALFELFVVDYLVVVCLVVFDFDVGVMKAEYCLVCDAVR